MTPKWIYLTPERRSAAIATARTGASRVAVASAAGVALAKFQRWLKEDPSFAQDLRNAYAEHSQQVAGALLTASVAIPGFPNYRITPCGQVLSINFTSRRPIRIRKQNATKGYFVVSFVRPDGSHCSLRVHRLVCEAFHGPSLGRCALHNNGNPLDNRAENLRWGTHTENMRDKYRHGTMPFGKKNGQHKRPLQTNREAA